MTVVQDRQRTQGRRSGKTVRLSLGNIAIGVMVSVTATACLVAMLATVTPR